MKTNNLHQSSPNLSLQSYQIYIFPATATSTFITPASTITQIGFIFTFLSKITHTTNIPTISQLVSDITIFPEASQNAVCKMEIPADPISATTAGLIPPSIPCSMSISRYFKYNFAMIVTIMQDGVIYPSVATTAPGIPVSFIPTKVAALIAIGPGVIWEMVIRSVNSVMLSQ